MLEFDRESAEREARLVDRHMRVAYSVPQHHQYLHGGAPSEPVLAEAAARIMNEMSDLLGTLTDHLKAGLVLKSERGKLLAQLLFTLAHDKCVEFDPGKVHKAQ